MRSQAWGGDERFKEVPMRMCHDGKGRYGGGCQFPHREGESVYSPDILVYVHWLWNPFFCAPAAFRVNPDMSWKDFQNMLEQFYSVDPDFQQVKHRQWRWFLITRENTSGVADPNYGVPFKPAPEKTLRELGITHKAFVKFEPIT
jgi:phenol hydroxylase P4 protein